MSYEHLFVCKIIISISHPIVTSIFRRMKIHATRVINKAFGRMTITHKRARAILQAWLQAIVATEI